MNKSNLSETIDKNFPEILQTASELVKIPSRNPPGEERRCAEYIYSRLKEFGLETYLVSEPFNNRPQVVAIIQGKNENAFLLNGHIDTVPEGDPTSWSMDPFSGAIRDGFLYGRGAVDMKSSLSIMMHITKFVKTNGSIILAFAVGEERAEPGTSTLLSWIKKKLDLRVRYGIVMEPTRLNIATHQRGAVWFRISVKGRSAHASAPNEGINAIEIARDIMQTIQEYNNALSNKQHKFAGAPTCSVTMISGGVKENVIPDRCDVVIDRRLVPSESSSEVANELRSVLDKTELDYEITQLGSREPVELSNDSTLAKTMLHVMHGMNIPSNIICFTGATDNEHLVANGIESLVWGPGDLKFAHAIDERISISDIKNSAIALGIALNKLS
jgi:succinyl-diaminopimelate desuccinylase